MVPEIVFNLIVLKCCFLAGSYHIKRVFSSIFQIICLYQNSNFHKLHVYNEVQNPNNTNS